MKKVLILGGTGMLGSMLVKVLGKKDDLAVTATYRSTFRVPRRVPFDGSKRVQWTEFNASQGSFSLMGILPEGYDWIINCIGLIKPHIDAANRRSTERAIDINSLFPHRLALHAERTQTHTLSIATDCVFSGRYSQGYTEDSPHDATDIYGKTKSLGEVASAYMHYLRCSIVGPEVSGRADSLLGWFTSQAQGATVKGFTNHAWNGLTTYAFAQLAAGIVQADFKGWRLAHVVPQDVVSKAQLLKYFKDRFRTDITVESVADRPIHRTLATLDAPRNKLLWEMGGYKTIPTIEQMVSELAVCGS